MTSEIQDKILNKINKIIFEEITFLERAKLRKLIYQLSVACYHKGKKDAQKEFLDKIEKWLEIDKKEDEDYIEFSVDEWKRFKQSLGENLK